MKYTTDKELFSLSREELYKYALKFNIVDPEFMTKKNLIEEILKIMHQNSNIIKKENIESEKILEIDKEEENKNISDEDNLVVEEKVLEEIYKNLKKQEVDKIDVPREIIFYENTEITEKDNLKIIIDKNFKEVGNIVLLENIEGYCGFLQIVEKDNEKFLIGDSKNLNLKRLNQNNFCKIIFFDKKDEKLFINIDLSKELIGYTVECDVEVKKLEKTQKRLCIDFGTTNTSIGTYDNNGRIDIVKFIDVTNEKKISEVLPTIVWVEDCSDSDNVVYKFGYEAKKKLEDSDFNFKNSIFTEIKKWICEDIEIVEKIHDAQGRKAEVKRKEIIEKYLLYVINKGENYFKNKFDMLHMSAPVKMKHKYIKTYKEMLDKHGYKVRNSELSLDEGIAIIYNYIKMKMDEVSGNDEIQEYPRDKDKTKASEKIIIIDAGGGTTDLASCNFTFKKSPKGYKLNIETNFEDGDSNFGGNNITYRILQFIKIKLAKYYDPIVNNQNTRIIDDIEELFPSNPLILEKIDEKSGIEDLYKNLEEIYEKSGEIIPTNFGGNNDKFNSRKQEAILKRNYFILWEVAEIVKKEFFKRTDLLMIDFKNEDEKNKKIKVPKLERLNISIVENNQLVEKKDLPNLSISIKEVEKIIYGEIYNILRKLLLDSSDNNILKNYDSFRLSGQTCKISLFAELLKEFIPGKKLRNSLISNERERDSLELKLQCLKGSIYFMFDTERGNISEQDISNNVPRLNYKIKLDRGELKEILSRDYIEISQYDITKAGEAKFDIYDMEDKFIKSEKYEFIFNKDKKEINLENILRKVSDNLKDSLRSQLENSEKNTRIIITIPKNEEFGFEVYDLIKNGEEKFILNGVKFFNFERSLSETTFFNGRR